MRHRIALALAVLPIVAAPPASAEWFRAQRSPTSVLVYTLASTTQLGAVNAAAADRGAAPMLAIECAAGETRVVVYWREPMAGFYRQAVRYTIDGTGPHTAQWRLSTDQESMGHWGGDAAAFARRLAAGRTLTVRAVTRRGAPVAATFRLENLTEAGAAVFRACNL